MARIKTIDERNETVAKREYRKQDMLLTATVREATRKKITYDEISKRSGLCKTTIVKVINNPNKATLEQLRRVCYAAGVTLQIGGEINCS